MEEGVTLNSPRKYATECIYYGCITKTKQIKFQNFVNIIEKWSICFDILTTSNVCAIVNN